MGVEEGMGTLLKEGAGRRSVWGALSSGKKI